VHALKTNHFGTDIDALSVSFQGFSTRLQDNVNYAHKNRRITYTAYTKQSVCLVQQSYPILTIRNAHSAKDKPFLTKLLEIASFAKVEWF
jgi:hypothetical protein